MNRWDCFNALNFEFYPWKAICALKHADDFPVLKPFKKTTFILF